MAPTVYWSSLPYELIRRVADIFLCTNDIGYYMDLYAVCHDWHNSTDDPCIMLLDPCFHPLGWVLLEAPSIDGNGIRRHCTFVNVNTGRFLMKEFPIPRLSQYIGSTSDCLLVF